MSRSRWSVQLAFSALEERITPAYSAADVANFLRAQRITATGNVNALGGIFRSWEHAGPTSDRLQRVVDAREAGQAVQGLLAYGVEATPGDNLATAKAYLQWYLLNVSATNGYIIQQQWYRDGGGFVRTTAPDSESPYIANFLQTAWEYVRLGGDREILNRPDFRTKILSMTTVLLGAQKSDFLFVSRAGETRKFLADNAEIYSGLLSAARLMAVVYADTGRAQQFDFASTNLRNAIQLRMYGGPVTGYGWVKDGDAAVTTVDDASNPWATTAVRLAPAIYGVDDPRGTRMTTQLERLNQVWNSSKSWVNRTVDTANNLWPVTGYGSGIISGNASNGNAHNDYIYDSRFAGNPVRPVNPLTTADAGWMLRTPGPFNQLPTADAQTLAVDESSSLPVTLTGSDPDGTALHYTVVRGPTHGTFVGPDANQVYTSNAAFTYTPFPGYSGPETILFKVSDGQFDSAFVPLTIAVNALPFTPPPPGVPPVIPPVIPGVPPVVPPVVPGVPPVVPGVPPTIPPVPPLPPLPTLSLTMTAVTSPATGNAVTLVTADGAIRSRFAAFEGVGAGGNGVRATLADFNADGAPDFLVGTGPGVATSVRALNGPDGRVLFSLAPFEASFTGGVFLATGDLTGDGVPDYAVSPDQGGGPRVRVYDGATQKQLIDFFGIDDPAFRGGARITFGDITGDGRLDLVVAAGFGGGPRVTVWDGNSLLGGAPKSVANFFAFETALRNGVYVAAGDFVNRDGRDDLAVGAGPGGGPRVSVFGGVELAQNRLVRAADFFAGNPNDRGGVTVAAKPSLEPGVQPLVYQGPNLVTGSGPGASVSRVRSYNLSFNPASAPRFDIEPLDGNSSGVYVG